MGPQGTETPQQPEQPVEQPQVVPEQQPQFSQAPQPVPGSATPKKGLSKGLLWGLIGGGVGLVLLIVGIVLAVTMLAGPTKDDYRKATTTFNEAVGAYNDMSSRDYEINSTSSTETSRKNALESMKKSQATFNSKFEESGKMKGIAGDKELKDKWNKINDRRSKFNASVEELYEISEKVTPILTEISDISSPTVAQVTSLIEKSEKAKVKNAATNTYVTALIKYLRAAKDYADYRASGSYDSGAYTKYSAAYDGYTDAAKDWSSAMKKMSEEVDLKDDLNSLSEAIFDKQLSK